MKTAREMFEELGFYCKCQSENVLLYTNENRTIDYFFNATFKDIDICDDYNCYCLTPKIVRAIYKQCEELGWLDE